MKTRALSIVLFAAGVVNTASPSGAQLNQRSQNQLGNRATQLRRPVPKNYLADLKLITDALAAKNNTKIVLDPSIFVAVKPTAPVEGSALPAALDALTSQLKKVSWRRVYLTQVHAGSPPPPEKLAASVRTLDQIEQAGLILENPLTRRATSYMKEFAVPANFGEALQAQQFSTDGIIVIYSTVGGPDLTKSAEDRFFDLQKQQMDMMMQMDPDQLGQAMSRGMELWNQMDPTTRSAFMGQMMRAGMQMFNNMSPDQKQQMMQDAMQMFGGLGGGFGGKPPR
jgi:hypothetical protein